MAQGSTDDCAKLFCKAARLPDSPRCLRHARPDELSEYIAGLRPGADVNHRGTILTGTAVEMLTTALGSDRSGGYRGADFGAADFRGAVFHDTANLKRALFQGPANFARAQFRKGVSFGLARFAAAVDFSDTTFLQVDQSTHGTESLATNYSANFRSVHFADDVAFCRAQFGVIVRKIPYVDRRLPWSWVGFMDAVFDGDVDFTQAVVNGSLNAESVRFNGEARFSACQFADEVRFAEAQFAQDALFEVVSFAGGTFEGAVFHQEANFYGAHTTPRDPVDVASATYHGRWVTTLARLHGN